LKTDINLTSPKNDAETEGEVLNTILELIYKAKNPVVLADACSIRHHVVPEVHELLEKLKIPGFVTPMGKGAIDETHSQYGGVYIGEISLPDVKAAVEASDCVLSIGALLSDFNTVRPLLQLIVSRDHSVIIFHRIRRSSFILVIPKCDMRHIRGSG
jgi:pyruvate decarboxylase